MDESYGFLRAASENAAEAAEGREHLRTFLRRLGYLDSTLEKFDDDELSAALRHYQSFYRLPVTGSFDDATAAQMTRPRCSVPDLPLRESTAGAVFGAPRWSGPIVTFGIVTPPSVLGAAAALSALTAAAALWDAVISISLVPSVTSDIEAHFLRRHHGDALPFDGPGGDLGHASGPPPHPTAGRMHHDDEESWGVALPIPTGGFDLVTHFAHELGHALGLPGHSSDPAALMFGSYTGPHRFLAPDDISRIQTIYGP
jgi:hypothetical protein